VNSVQALAVLYDVALTIGSEVTLNAQLERTLQRLLYHTGLPVGIAVSEPIPTNEPDWMQVRLETAIGDYGLIRRKGQSLRLPAVLFEKSATAITAPDLLVALATRRPAGYLLRLPIEGFGFAFLIGPQAPNTALPLTELFLPILARLATAIAQCRQLAERTAQLEAANRELESFSYSVSHDLRAPLRAIDGFSKILLEDYSAALDPQGRHYLDVLRQNAERMGRLIEDILHYSRTGRQEITAVALSIEELARAVLAELLVGEGDRRIRLDVHPMPRAHGDPMMLRQVLQNLLGNAIKFTRPRPEAVIEIGGEMQAGDDVFYVRDNGVGFDMQYADKLFGIFERLHSKDQFEGSGVGLAIVKRIILRHGGRVWAEGKVDSGATFYFSLPRRNAD
jgi:signal transduction histidine kinase